jgi:hypothetical protein
MDHDQDPPSLLVEQENGGKWWLLGRIFEPDRDELKKIPAWSRSASSRRRHDNPSATLPADVILIKRSRG